MRRFYFLSGDVELLEQVERELIAAGIPEEQIHTLSEAEAELEEHHLRPVSDFMKTDVIWRGLQGFAVGVVVSTAILGLTAAFDWWRSVGWTPFVYLAVAALGFCTWEGGFLGFQERNHRFDRFQAALRAGRHLFFVDVTPDQVPLLEQVVARYPALERAGSGGGMPQWVVNAQRRFKQFLRWAP
ncbi:MAG: hypothetical protein KatS3mg124_1492 [Porticoccaceae bacterium]|nr:MAG: hypothetical protein KatS3mg124_1492 [Porticoccaceae bacterium]